MQVLFGEFTVDTDSRQLRHGDADRHLSPKAFEFLRLLIENRPRALSKAELHERLWPSTFVSDATLTSLVAEVRAALGEHAQDGRFVRTVHRFGYAFNGTATEAAAAERVAAPHDLSRCWVIWEWGQIALADGEHLLGRDADVAVWLESPTVSRHHARLSVRGTEAIIEDLGSKNGTYLRGARLTQPSPVTDGDEIRVGSIAVKVRLLEAIESTVTQHSGRDPS
jgi:DNA-binding winged helix-turn-helix (wHTH) protein